MNDANARASEPTRERSFRSAVADLTDGGVVLVTSTGPERLHRRCCRQLLGGTDDERLRVLGVTGGRTGTRSTTDRLPDGAATDPSALRVVYNDVPTRAGATTETGTTETGFDIAPGADRGPVGAGGDRSPVRRLSNAPIGTFGKAIHEAVGDLVAENGGEAADGQLRVCVEDVAELVDDTDAATVARFVHLLGTGVRSHGGILHVHATLGADSHPVRTLAPFVDWVIRLRLRGGEAEMRWEATDGPASEWIPLDWITT